MIGIETGVALLLHAATPEHRPRPHRELTVSRSAQNRWHDSGVVQVWRGVPTWIRSLSLCIRRHESLTAGHYRAHNGHSSAAGAYQAITSTWQGSARWTPLARPWAHTTADKAPPYAQDAWFIHVIRHGGARAWHGTGCPST
jgi:hypothetical protein